MPGLDARIQDLVTYAETKGDGDKTVLFRNLIDLFLTQQAPSKQPTRSQLLTVIVSLLPHVASETRHTAADLIAAMPKPPIDLAVALSVDTIDIVEPLLLRIPFDEDQMIELITKTGKDHHQLIATRSDLSANVWIALARASRSAGTDWNTPQAASSSGSPMPSNVTSLHAGTLRVSSRKEPAPGEPALENDPPALLIEPVQGGWTFSSDRDGFVTALSDRGIDLLPKTGSIVGDPLLDFLGLNAKLGHPVARAFQRRSAIHDAPIYLGSLPKGNRYWTLSAKPFFQPETGGFAGYQGQLSPAALRQHTDQGASEDEIVDDLADTAANPADYVGLEPVDTGLDPVPDDGDSLFADEIDSSKALPSETINKEPPARLYRDAIVASPSTQVGSDTSPIGEMIKSLLEGAVRDRIEQDVATAVAEQVADQQEDTSHHVSPPKSSGDKKADVDISAINSAAAPEIQEALDTLAQALAALKDDASGARKTNRALQIAIAEACCTALRDALLD